MSNATAPRPTYLQVPWEKWKRFLHYRNRKPRWIKVDTELLHDSRFLDLTDAERGQLVVIWLLAACNDNRLLADSGWLRRCGAMTRPPSVARLMISGWLEPWSETSHTEFS